MQKKKKLRRRFESEAKKTSRDIEFYRYLKLIDTFEWATLVARSYWFKCQNQLNQSTFCNSVKFVADKRCFVIVEIFKWRNASLLRRLWTDLLNSWLLRSKLKVHYVVVFCEFCRSRFNIKNVDICRAWYFNKFANE